MDRALLVLLMLLVSVFSSSSFAQVYTPYNPPFPGAVAIQPCGQELGWVPADHPAATDPNSYCKGEEPEPTPDHPWLIAPNLPMEVGKAYRDPYGLVMEVTSALVQYRKNAKTGLVEATVLSIDALWYQSLWHYDQKLEGRPTSVDPDKGRGVWWELQ